MLFCLGSGGGTVAFGGGAKCINSVVDFLNKSPDFLYSNVRFFLSNVKKTVILAKNRLLCKMPKSFPPLYIHSSGKVCGKCVKPRS